MERVSQRHIQISELVQKLDRGQWCAIIAPAYSGKSALARQLVERLKTAHPTWRVVSVSFRNEATLEKAWLRVLDACRLMGCSVDGLADKRVGEGLLALTDEHNPECCLVIDDLEALPDQVLSLFCAEMRRYRMSRQSRGNRDRLHCVLFGESKLLFQTLPTSPLSNVLELVSLPDLTRQQAAECLANWLEVEVSEDVSQTLFDETAGHPHLVEHIAEALKTGGTAPNSASISAAAREWVENCALLRGSLDPCFENGIRYLRAHLRAFRAVIDLLASDGAIPIGLDTHETIMSGVVVAREKQLAFRGLMFEQALGLYLDDLRRADLWALHGDWKEANACYHRVPPTLVRERRQQDDARAGPSILDLCIGLLPCALECQQMNEAEALVADASLGLFGADCASVWRLESGGKEAVQASVMPAAIESNCRTTSGALAATAARNHATLTLERNLGVVQGIGVGEESTRWAIELFFERGTPGGGWVEKNVKYVEATLFTALERARQRELGERRLGEQRKLIQEINLGLQRSTALDEILAIIVNGIRDRLRYECAQVSLVFGKENRIRAVRSNGAFELIKADTDRELDGSDVLAQVVRNRKAWNVVDCGDPRFGCNEEAIRTTRLKSQAVLPLIDRDKVVGVLQVGDTQRTGAFQQGDVELFQPLADCAAVTIRSAREREAFTQGFDVAGCAVALVDAEGRIESCNHTYSKFFGLTTNQVSCLKSEHNPEGNEFLTNVAFSRGTPVKTVREIGGRKVAVTAVGLGDPLGRPAGGIEIVWTEGSLYGITDALAKMLKITDEAQLGQAVVDCVCDYLGYSRARFYRYDSDADSLVSVASKGLDVERAKNFADGLVKFKKGVSRPPEDSFECLLHERPLIIIRRDRFEEKLPLSKICHDSRKRRVFVIDESLVDYIDALDKGALVEWLDVPLIAGGEWLGKLSIDKKGSNTLFELEDVELLGLFGRWASEAFARVRAIERARRKAELVGEVRRLGDREGLEPLALDFLITITIQGGPGFNRAMLFLRDPQTDRLQGFCCHGAATGTDWRDSLRSIGTPSDRRAFIEAAIRQHRSGAGSEHYSQQQAAFQKYIVSEQEGDNPLALAAKRKEPVILRTIGARLGDLYATLQWQEAEEAILCPLVHGGQCDGLLYVDRAFSRQPITDEDKALLETLSLHLAAVARPLRLAEQLRGQILNFCHRPLSPLAAVRALAESLADEENQRERKRLTNLLVAESQKASDTARLLIRLAALETEALKVDLRRIDATPLLKERLAPYLTLLRMDGFENKMDLPRDPVLVEADPELLGDVFAELADNASTAITVGGDRTGEIALRAECRMEGDYCVFTFINSGPPVPRDLERRLFQQFESGWGGTGLGLWLVAKIVSLHRGTVSYSRTQQGFSCFTVKLPQTDSGKETAGQNAG